MHGFGCQHRRIFNSFGRLLKWRRRTKEHCVLRVAVLRENVRNTPLELSGGDVRFYLTLMNDFRVKFDFRYLDFSLLYRRYTCF